MNKAGIHGLLKEGEGIQIEFKESFAELNKDTFETICAFLNRKGGHLLLGVTNSAEVKGVLDSEAERLKMEIINNANNPGKLNPAFPLSPEIIDIEGKKVIYIYVPESSMVHSTVGKTYDRSGDADLDISKQQAAITQLHLRKQQTFTENRIYPYLKISDLRPDLMARARRLARSQRPDHPWLEMGDEDMLRSAGLFQHDYQTGQDGYTLAAALLFGKDEVIQNIVPYYKTDALYRVQNLDRYDDRDDIRTNLIEAYDRLMAFIGKHLPDKFYQEPDAQRVSIRDKIFREVVANMLIHREYANPYHARLVIERDKVVAENWNKPHTHGLLKPDTFAPYTKNPVLTRFFKEIGRMDELGSGVRNLFKYGPEYASGRLPEISEEDVFKIVIPVDEGTIEGINEGTEGINEGSGGVNEGTGGVNEGYGGVNERTGGVNEGTEGVNEGTEGVNEGSEGVNEGTEGVNQKTKEITGGTEGMSEAVNKAIEQVIAGTRTDMREKLKTVALAIFREPGLRLADIGRKTDLPVKSIERYIKHLRDAGFVEYRGSPKAGGYYLIDKAKLH